MDKKIIDLAKAQKTVEPSVLLAFMAVETGGKGFDVETGKIIIQFEPAWFRKKEPFAPSGKWSLNGIERQKAEWIAFNDAFFIDKESAMESTSIGLGQIMGFHWKRLGFTSVGEMWDDAKRGITNQVGQILRFISTDAKLLAATRSKDWETIATIYNGAGYKKLAQKIGREPYDVSMKKEYENFKKLGV
jgi:hypothetical protein